MPFDLFASQQPSESGRQRHSFPPVIPVPSGSRISASSCKHQQTPARREFSCPCQKERSKTLNMAAKEPLSPCLVQIKDNRTARAPRQSRSDQRPFQELVPPASSKPSAAAPAAFPGETFHSLRQGKVWVQTDSLLSDCLSRLQSTDELFDPPAFLRV